MTPTIVLDSARKPLLAIGSPGGSRITYTVLTPTLLRINVFGPRCPGTPCNRSCILCIKTFASCVLKRLHLVYYQKQTCITM